MGRSDAVGASVAAADHEDILTLGSDALVFREFHTSEDAVLLGEEFEGEVYTLQFAAGGFEIAGGGRAGSDDDGIELLCKLL